MTTKVDSVDAVLAAVKAVYQALLPLDEKSRRSVLASVTELLGSPAPLSNPAAQPQYQPGVGITTATVGTPSGQSAKDFIKAKQPISEVQRIACLAYYLTHSKNQPKFKTRDVTLLNSEAGGSRLSNPSMTMMNAERQNGFLAPAGGGQKQMTAYGEDVVNALPNQEAVKILISNRRKPRRRIKKHAA